MTTLRKRENSLHFDGITRRIRELIASRTGSNKSIDLEVARILGISRRGAGNKLKGDRGWKPKEISDIADAYGVSSAALMDDTTDAIPHGILIEKNLQAQPLHPHSFVVKSFKSGGQATRAKDANVDLPADTFLVRIHGRGLEPHMPEGSLAVVSRTAKVTNGNKAFVHFKDGRNLFGLALVKGNKVQVMVGIHPQSRRPNLPHPRVPRKAIREGK